MDPAREHRGLVRWGWAVAIGTVLIPLLWPVAAVLGILVLVLARRGGAGAGILVVGAVIGPLIGAALWQAVLVKPYRAPSQAMEPTIGVGDRFLVSRVSYRIGSPQVGQIAVFHPPRGAEENVCGAQAQPDGICPRPTSQRADVTFVKRVVAGPGDLVAIDGGRVRRNGRLLEEPYARRCGSGSAICDLPRPVRIPAGHYLMMGDNRGESADSREWGPVPEDWFIGRRLFTYWHGD